MRARLALVGLFGAVMAVTAACGDGAPTPSSSGSSASVGTGAPSGLGTPAVTITMESSLSFSPATASAKVGQVVEWDNPATGVPHNATFDDPSITSGTVAPGSTWQVKFSTAGTYKYQCTFHQPSMVGTLTVS